MGGGSQQQRQGCRFGIVLSRQARSRRVRAAGDGGTTRSALDAFCRALGRATGFPLRPHVLSTYESLLKRLDWGIVDLAWLPPVVALRAITRSGATPIAVPVRGDNAWFWTAIFVAPDSSVHGLADLEGTRAVWVDPDSASGYLMPRAALAAEGIDPDAVFAEQSFAGAHDDVVRTVLADRRAVGATFVHFDADGRVCRSGWGDADVQLLKTAGPIPGDLLAAASTSPAGFVAAARSALVDGGSDEVERAAKRLFAAGRFAAVERAHVAHLELLGRSLSSLHTPIVRVRRTTGTFERDSRSPRSRPGPVSTRPTALRESKRKAR